MNVKPLNGKILVKIVNESKSDSGIILPESKNSKSIKAEVISVGSGVVNSEKGSIQAIDIKVGDIVFCPKWNGTIISDEHAKDEYVIVKYEDILGVMGE